jgi:hypothetical protein
MPSVPVTDIGVWRVTVRAVLVSRVGMRRISVLVGMTVCVRRVAVGVLVHDIAVRVLVAVLVWAIRMLAVRMRRIRRLVTVRHVLMG